jgi:Sec-independent protein secretion pathway component TatC
MPNRGNLDTLRRNRGYALIAAFVVSTLMQWRAAPDAISMAIVALSMYVLFEVGLLVAKLVIKQ